VNGKGYGAGLCTSPTHHQRLFGGERNIVFRAPGQTLQNLTARSRRRRGSCAEWWDTPAAHIIPRGTPSAKKCARPLYGGRQHLRKPELSLRGKPSQRSMLSGNLRYCAPASIRAPDFSSILGKASEPVYTAGAQWAAGGMQSIPRRNRARTYSFEKLRGARTASEGPCVCRARPTTPSCGPVI